MWLLILSLRQVHAYIMTSLTPRSAFITVLSDVVFCRYCIKTYTGHRDWVRIVTVSPDGMVSLVVSLTHELPTLAYMSHAGLLLASCSNDQVS